MRGLLATRRFGRITRYQFALASGLREDYSGKLIAQLIKRKKPLLSVVSLGAAFGTGKLADMIGLTVHGNTLVEACSLQGGDNDILQAAAHDVLGADLIARIDQKADLSSYFPYVVPGRTFDDLTKLRHRLQVIDTCICLERDLPRSFAVDKVRAEFRREPQTGRYATMDRLPDGTEIKPDAVVTIKREGVIAPILLEIDMGTETIKTFDSGLYAKTVEANLAARWRYLATGRVVERYGTTVPLFQVVFITTSEKRMHEIIRKTDWMKFKPVHGQYPNAVFYFSTHESCREDFFGEHWWTPGARRPGFLISLEEGKSYAA
jgi:hypothetical protein